MVAEKQQVGDMHNFAAEMGSQSYLHILGEGQLEHKDEGGDVEGEEGLRQCWCLVELASTEHWINHLDDSARIHQHQKSSMQKTSSKKKIHSQFHAENQLQGRKFIYKPVMCMYYVPS
jgi:hypothetical protein